MRVPRHGLSYRARECHWLALALITAAAAALRLIDIGHVPPDPFYDAAVRSMTLSWHNFFFGAYEPGASVSIDKPPLDLWLQVASVELFGFSETTLKLPEALAGTAAVPVLFLAVRRMWSATAGIAAALVLALLPVEVITSRSDTMDGVMMLLLVLALLSTVVACQRGSVGWLLLAAAALGIAFDVKLLESTVALPGMVVLAALGLPWPWRRRLVALLAAGAVYLAVALSWLTATLLVPAHDRPWAIGSTNGSAWNAAFVFNGTERLSGKTPEPQFTPYQPGHHYPEATQVERDHIPITPPSATRLLVRIGPLSGERLGLALLVALLLGVPALLGGLRRRAEDVSYAGDRLRRAAGAGLAVWLVTGIVLFSDMQRLHPRYVEGFTPAVAAMFGIGVAWLAGARPPLALAALALALAATVYYVGRLQYGTTTVWWVTLVCALAALALAAFACKYGRRAAADRANAGDPVRLRQALLQGCAIALMLIAVLVTSLRADVTAIQDHVTDAGDVGALPGAELRPLSAYLRAHQGGARYELAAESATQIGALIARDARPVVVLASYGARIFTSLGKLKRLIAAGAVRYGYVDAPCDARTSAVDPACTPAAKWVRAHGTDVSRQAGLGRTGVLWLLPGART